MVITALRFGLGNQLFQYAAGRALSERLRTSLWLDTTHYTYFAGRDMEVTQLRLRARVLPIFIARLLTPGPGSTPWKTALRSLCTAGFNHLEDDEQGYDTRLLDAHGSCWIDGFWQSERYFAHLRPALLEELEPREKLSNGLEEFARRLSTENSIAVHVRRGDLITNAEHAAIAGALGADYYVEALECLRSQVGRARVYLFSDDPEWCEKNIPQIFPTELVSERITHSAFEDLTVMKRCRHFVIANSTFGWWAAWLGTDPSKQVIAPANFFRTPRTWEKDILPPAWETVGSSFEPLPR